MTACQNLHLPGLDKACPQRRVCGTALLNKPINKSKKVVIQ
jgi:hypothetical protein